jgi:hypothetical protein
LHIVSDLTTNKEALVAQNGIGNGADGAAGLEVGKDATVEVVLLEVEVGLLALVASVGVEVGEELRLQARGDGVVQLDLGGQEVGRVPGLGDADAVGKSLLALKRERESAIVRRGALRGEVDTIGGLQLDLEGSYRGSATATSGQRMRRTCSSMVEVLVDKVVGGLRNVAEGWRRCLEDNRALDLDVLGGGHDGGWVWW